MSAFAIEAIQPENYGRALPVREVISLAFDDRDRPQEATRPAPKQPVESLPPDSATRRACPEAAWSRVGCRE